MQELENLTTYRRYLLERANLLIVLGDINPVIDGMVRYNARYKIKQPRSELMPMVRELMAAVGLASVWLAERESWGWSLTLPGALYGFFVGAEPEGMLCLRLKEAEGDRGVVLVQRQKANLPLTQSHLEPKTDSLSKVVEQYFEEVEQTGVRLAVGQDGRGVLIHALPGGDFGEVSALSGEDLLSFASKAVDRGECKDVGEVVLFYECRCSREMISNMVSNMSEAERLELWGDMKELQIECPRCGREYVLRRAERSGN